MEPVSILVLGVGPWGRVWLDVLAHHDRFAVAGIASRREQPGGRRHYPSYERAIEDSDADAVLVTLPVRLHADAILRAIAAGKHVLCEKPVVGSRDELSEILAASSERPEIVVMVGQNYRHRPWAIYLRSLINEGTLGGVSHISLRFSQPELLEGDRTIMRHPLLEDMSIHHFDLLRYITGRNAVEIYAQEHRPRWSRYSGNPGLDAVIGLDDGVVVNYSGTWAGRGGYTTWDGEYAIQCERGLLTMKDGIFTVDPETGASAHTMPASTTDRSEPAADLRGVLDAFHAAVVLGEDPGTSISDNARSIEMLFAAQDSLRLRQPVRI